jgi:PAS domain S-box-containing protein
MTKDDRQAESAPSEPPCQRNEEPAQGNTELEKFNRALLAERHSLQRELANCSLLLKASTTGLISLDKTGLIVDLNASAVELLGADEAYLLKKPISLFIAPEEQATFYINRSRIVAGTQKKPFELKLRQKSGTTLSVRIKARPITSPGHHLPGMLLAVDDITAYRQAMEKLQFKEDFARLLFSTIDDLASWSTADIDEVIITALEKIGIVSGADRVYVCLFHERKGRLTITHEWLGEGIGAPALKDEAVGPFLNILRKINQQSAASIADINTLPPAERAMHEGFHAAGVKSFLFAPLVYGRNLLGIVGCDAVRQTASWSRETQQLVKCIGSAIVHALIRRQTEKVPAHLRQSIFQLVPPTSPTAADLVPEYDGPIDIIDEGADIPDQKETGWRFAEEKPDDPDQIGTVLLKDGKTASLACSHCNRQRQLDISEIRVFGTHLKVTCICGNVTYIKVELRREHRKTVNLEGIFMRGPGDRLALKSDDWGRIQIYNLSRRGVGFKVAGRPAMRVGDRLRVKFTLDNTAESIIQKEVAVRSVAGEMIGCQFESQDACDVTLGFYLMN